MTENKVKDERSTEWSLSLELAKSNKRMFIVLITVIVLWFTTIAGFVIYLNQYDFTDYEIQQGGEWGNTFIGGANEGDLTYGAENPSEETNPKE
jgi:hypothetical protein